MDDFDEVGVYYASASQPKLPPYAVRAALISHALRRISGFLSRPSAGRSKRSSSSWGCASSIGIGRVLFSRLQGELAVERATVLLADAADLERQLSA